MIISDRYRFVFIHIPKCAGSFVRRQLLPYDDTDGRFSGKREQKPVLGVWDYAHIPLSILRQYFPSDFERVQTHNSFAVIRNPFERFPSSIAQRLKQFGGTPLHTLGPKEIEREVESTISYLSQSAEITDASYVHFTRQSEYLELNDKRIVRNLYSTDTIDQMLHDIADLIGKPIVGNNSQSIVNQTAVYRHEAMRRLFEAMRPMLGGPISMLLPEKAKRTIRRFLYIFRDNKKLMIFSGQIRFATLLVSIMLAISSRPNG